MVERKRVFRYCPSCGEDVFTYSVSARERIEIRCSSCGLPLEVGIKGKSKPLDCIIIADDDKSFRSDVAELLIKRGIGLSVISCESGSEFLSQITGRLRNGLPVALAILDVLMPYLDGVATAKALRAVEKGFQLSIPIPILFLFPIRTDESLQKAISRCQPAFFLNKGPKPNPDQMVERIEKVVSYFLKEPFKEGGTE